ncbi:hypothetical protein IscW_ISCW007515, partial [Ixodes scapularis]
ALRRSSPQHPRPRDPDIRETTTTGMRTPSPFTPPSPDLNGYTNMSPSSSPNSLQHPSIMPPSPG